MRYRWNILVATPVVVATWFWAFFLVLDQADVTGGSPGTLLLQAFVGFFLVLLLSTLFHELFHVLAVLAVGQRVTHIEIGAGPKLVRLRVRGVTVVLGRRLFGGGRVRWTAWMVGYRRRLVVISAGVLFHVAVVLTLLPFVNGSWKLTLILGVNLAQLLANVIPGRLPDGHPNDGSTLLRLLRDRPASDPMGSTRAFAVLQARAEAGDVEPLLTALTQTEALGAPEGAELAAFRAVRGFALSLLGRFDEAAALVEDSDRVAAGDHRVCAALFGQLNLTTGELEHLKDLFSSAMADLPADAIERRAGMSHSLAVTHLLMGQPRLALPLLDLSRDGVTSTANRAAVDATCGLALAKLGDREGATALLRVVERDAPWSPWLRVLRPALHVPA